MDTGDQLVDDTGRTAYFVRGQQVIDRRGRVAYLIRHHHLINPDTGAAAFRVREQCVLDLDTGAVVYRVRASRALDLTSIVVSDPRPSDPSGRRVLIPVPLRQAVTSGDAPAPREVYEAGLKTAFGFGTDEFSSRTRWDFGE